MMKISKKENDIAHKLLSFLEEATEWSTKLSRAPNVFDALRESEAELKHSNFLAYLLRTDENHKLGDKFLKLFLAEVLIAASRKQDIEVLKHLVCAEALSSHVIREEGNVDLKIELLDEKTVIIIENKWNASERAEGDDNGQLCKYRTATESHIAYTGMKKIYVFLTLDGHITSVSSEAEHWIPLSYTSILHVHEKILDSTAGDAKVRSWMQDHRQLIYRKTGGNPVMKNIYNDIVEAYNKLKEINPDGAKSLYDRFSEDDLFNLYRRDGFMYNSKLIKAEPKPNNSKYLQFMHMFPKDLTDSVHFEILKHEHKGVYVPEFHIENGADAEVKKTFEEIFKKPIANQKPFRCSGKKIKYVGRSLADIKHDLDVELCKLMDKYLPILEKTDVV